MDNRGGDVREHELTTWRQEIRHMLSAGQRLSAVDDRLNGAALSEAGSEAQGREHQPALVLAREVRFATEELALPYLRLAAALDASNDDLGRSLDGRSATAAVFIRCIRVATVRYARRLEEAIDHYEALDEDRE